MALLSNPIAVFVVDLLRGYGSERYTVQLVNALAAKGASVDLIVQEKGETLANDVDSRVSILEIGTRNPFKTVLFLRRYLEKAKPAAFFTTMEKPSLLGIVASAWARYRNVVPTIHFDIDAYASLEYGARRKFLRLLVAIFYRYPKTVVAVSSGVAKSLRRWIGPRPRIVTILNGFDLRRLRERAAEKPDHPWLAEKTLPVVVSCGRLVPLKGFDTLIKAFARVRAIKPARLIIFGEDEQRAKLQDLIGALGLQNDALLAGYTPNLQANMAASDVFVLSSRSEGFGNVIAEALACGVAVVSTDCPSGPREILDGGRYGQLVPVDDDKAMAAAILQALDNPLDDKARAETQSYLDRRFALSIMADQYLALVESL